MSDILGVLVDDQPQFEFDRSKPVPDQHLAYLAQMDSKMDHGVTLQGQSISDPDMDARARFVAANLANALAQGKDKLAMAMIAWLGVRRPELKQVRISPGEMGMTVDLDYEQPHEKPEPQPQVVTFHPTRH